ncbi:MAG: flagellar basal body rod protein FlgC [Nitrospiria bacterium]
MNIEQAFSIPASGLSAQRERLNAISSNLANINSTKTSEGGPYRRQDVLFSSVPLEEGFQAMLGQSRKALQKVEVTEIISSQKPFKKVFEPEHPDANAEGYVSYPNVNPMEEMVNMISALRSYEANVTVLGAVKSMAQKALEISG